MAFTNQTQFEGEIPEYLWDFGDGQTSTEVSPSHTYAWFDVSDLPAGVYVVRVQSRKGTWIGKVMKE